MCLYLQLSPYIQIYTCNLILCKKYKINLGKGTIDVRSTHEERFALGAVPFSAKRPQSVCFGSDSSLVSCKRITIQTFQIIIVKLGYRIYSKRRNYIHELIR